MKPLYTYEEAVHNLHAPREVVPIIIELLKPQSVLDVGCGIGTWLSAFEEKGISDCMGVDGDHVDRTMLKINSQKFYPWNLQNSFSLGRKFDVVLSLEVAEHLDEKYADVFVESLVKHGDNIIFSAAIPNQGGQNHLNEQWPQYWQKKFLKHGFYFDDCIRPLIWENPKVDWWYKQNMFFVSKRYRETAVTNSVHPELFNFKINELNRAIRALENADLGVVYNFKLFIKALRKFFKL